jgi:phage shock protein PspC (stress-responsive transcriptional regulator)
MGNTINQIGDFKTLYRSEKNRKILGVCGGLSEYFEIDATLIRIIWLIFAIFGGGLFLLLYFILYFIIPLNNSKKEPLILNMKNFKEKRLKRIVNNRIIAGICGGIGKYFTVDPTIIRIIFVILDIITGFIPLAILYLIMIWIIPLATEELTVKV